MYAVKKTIVMIIAVLLAALMLIPLIWPLFGG
jgi:hypothetical protein